MSHLIYSRIMHAVTRSRANGRGCSLAHSLAHLLALAANKKSISPNIEIILITSAVSSVLSARERGTYTDRHVKGMLKCKILLKRYWIISANFISCWLYRISHKCFCTIIIYTKINWIALHCSICEKKREKFQTWYLELSVNINIWLIQKFCNIYIKSMFASLRKISKSIEICTL